MLSLRLSLRGALLTASGIWLGLGLLLFVKGILFLMRAAFPELLGGRALLLPYLSPLFGGAQPAALGLFTVALLVGYLKGRFVLGKAALRISRRLMGLSQPLLFTQIYDRRMLILIALMMCLGMSLNFLGCPEDLRGTIDCGVGTALFVGAFVFMRVAWKGG